MLIISCTVEAAKTAKQVAKTADVWTLVTILPRQYREPVVIPAPDPVYEALYTFIISMIVLSGGVVDELKFGRMMRKAGVEEYNPLGPTDKLLQRLIKDGYIVKIKDDRSGEEMFEYMVGPLGKVEVDKHAIANTVRAIWGEGDEELERKIEKSLNLGGLRGGVTARVNGNAANEHVNGAAAAAEGSETQRRSPGMRRQTEGDREEEVEDLDEESD